MADFENITIENKNHEKHIAEGIASDYFSPKTPPDIELVTDDGTLMAHKFVLANCSEFFSRELQTPNSTGPQSISLPSFMKNDVDDLLQFMYTGKVTLEESRMKRILASAKELKIYGLMDKPQEMVQCAIKTEENDTTEVIITFCCCYF